MFNVRCVTLECNLVIPLMCKEEKLEGYWSHKSEQRTKIRQFKAIMFQHYELVSTKTWKEMTETIEAGGHVIFHGVEDK